MDDRIREALDEALSLLGELMSYDNFEAYPPYVVERIKDFIAPFDKNGIALLDAPVASDARELAVVIQGNNNEHCDMPLINIAARLIESFAADRERKAREETARKCAEAVRSWMLRGQAGGADRLEATIMEAAHE